MHAYYPDEPGRPQRSWQVARAHLDFRGTGGYVIVPPSTIPVAEHLLGTYELISGPQSTPGPIDALALRDFLTPRPEHPFRPDGGSRAQDARRLTVWVAALREGERNRGLFWAACRLAETGAPLVSALDMLGPAAEHAGLPPSEVFTTIRSAYRTVGATSPRTGIAVAPRNDAQRRAAPVRGGVLS